MGITGSQIKAARVFLDWTQPELAEIAGVSEPTIKNAENGKHKSQDETANKIKLALEKHGIEFLDDDGLRKRSQKIKVYKEAEGYKEFFDHVYDTLKDNGGRVRQFNFSDDKYLSLLDKEFVEKHLERMAKITDLDALVLAVNADTSKRTRYCRYRELDKKFKRAVPFYLYGDFVVLALVESQTQKEIVTIDSKLVADGYAEQFDMYWNLSGASKGKG